MIATKTRYKTHNDELWAIVKTFKIWKHYLKNCKHEVPIFIDHHNLLQFMNMENLSSCQVRWAQKLSNYHFQIDYCYGKANKVANALSRFPQRSFEEEEKLRAVSSHIFHHLQISLTNANLSDLSLSKLMRQLIRASFSCLRPFK